MFGITSIVSVAITALFASSAEASPTGKRELTRRQTYSGQGTYYGVGLGACGITNVDTDLVVAVSDDMFADWPGATANPNLNPICGLQLTAFYGTANVTVSVVDRCGGCAYYDLDFSTGAFDLLSDEAPGRIDITWEWVSNTTTA